jgi:YD repeat-containing protein
MDAYLPQMGHISEFIGDGAVQLVVADVQQSGAQHRYRRDAEGKHIHTQIDAIMSVRFY